MAGWALQMVKMFYEEPHIVRYSGKDGEITFREITQDSVADGLVAEVKASSVDKQTRRSEAMTLVQAESIDPQTLFEDLDVDNPKERTRRLLAFQTGANDGYSAYMKELEGDVEPGVPEEGGEITMTGDQALQDLQAIQSGQPVEPQGIPSDAYVKVFEEFISGPDFDAQPPEIQQAVQQYIVQLQQIVSEKAGADGQAQAPVQGQPAQPQAAPSFQGQPTV